MLTSNTFVHNEAHYSLPVKIYFSLVSYHRILTSYPYFVINYDILKPLLLCPYKNYMPKYSTFKEYNYTILIIEITRQTFIALPL